MKSYAVKDYEYLFKLFFTTSKLSVYLLWIIVLPLCLSIDFVLHLWLKEVPGYTKIFTVLILIYSVINVLNNPIWALALAVGKLKNYILYGSAVFFLIFPISYLFLRYGYPPQSIFVISIIVRCFYIYTVLVILKKEITFSLSLYFKEVILPVLCAICVSGCFCFWIDSFWGNSLIQRFTLSILSFLIVIITILLVGLNESERCNIISIIQRRVLKYGK